MCDIDTVGRQAADQTLHTLENLLLSGLEEVRTHTHRLSQARVGSIHLASLTVHHYILNVLVQYTVSVLTFIGKILEVIISDSLSC